MFKRRRVPPAARIDSDRHGMVQDRRTWHTAADIAAGWLAGELHHCRISAP
jgi:hypothetical protein